MGRHPSVKISATMNLSHQVQSGTLVLSPEGRIDQDTCEAFQAALKPHLDGCRDGAGTIVMDMGKIEYISSAGLRCFMIAAKQAKAQGGRIVLAGMKPVVAEIFHISRFNLLFQIHAGVDEAVAAVRVA